MSTVQAYSSSLAREQFLFNETRIVVRLHADEHLDIEEIVARVHDENLFQYKTERSLKKKAMGACRRIGALGDETLVDLIAHGPTELMGSVSFDSTPAAMPWLRRGRRWGCTEQWFVASEEGRNQCI